ncbi:hypothetical protein LCGC14_1802320, partial [marine sediment metagenome]
MLAASNGVRRTPLQSLWGLGLAAILVAAPLPPSVILPDGRGHSDIAFWYHPLRLEVETPLIQPPLPGAPVDLHNPIVPSGRDAPWIGGRVFTGLDSGG